MLNQQWVLRHRPTGTVSGSDIELVEAPLRLPQQGEALVRNLYLSLDPTNRLWMSDREQYLPPIRIGDVVRGSTIGMVEESRSERFRAGDIVKVPVGGWQSFCITKEAWLTAVPQEPAVPLTAHLSVLGTTGLTAYFGLLDVGRPSTGETLVVSAAAGAVGSIVGQIGKMMGCRVVGIAGGSAKCGWLTEELGFDAAIDYKSQNVGAMLDRHCPDGIDIAFENVGGAIMDAIFDRLRLNGRMALCGMISGYNDEKPLRGPADFGRVLMKRLTIRGFVVIDYFERSEEALLPLAKWISEGRLKWKDHVVKGLEQAPDALDRLFTGRHDGKLMIEISPS